MKFEADPNFRIRKAETPQQIEVCEKLAYEIWPEHYTPLIGPAQVGYMLERFQSAPAIRRQIAEEDFRYFLLDRMSEPIGYFAILPKGRDLF